MQKKLLYFFSLSILFLFLSALPISATEKEDTVSVNVFNNMYYGTLEKNNDGESVFSLFSDRSVIAVSKNSKSSLLNSIW